MSDLYVWLIEISQKERLKFRSQLQDKGIKEALKMYNQAGIVMCTFNPSYL